MNGRDYMGLVAQMPCAICGRWPVEVHHRRTGVGAGRRASDFETIPLCTEHHRGNAGLHGMGRRAWERAHGITELELLARTALAVEARGRQLRLTTED